MLLFNQGCTPLPAKHKHGHTLHLTRKIYSYEWEFRMAFKTAGNKIGKMFLASNGHICNMKLSQKYLKNDWNLCSHSVQPKNM